MNRDLFELLKGAGLEHIVIPRNDFIKEHKHLIQLLKRSDDPALRKEASSQKKELEAMTGGNAKAGFIRRLMWENQHKHNGEYTRPVYPLADDSTMKQPWKFKYHKIANREQSGTNKKDYGASPFIQRHFGNVRAEVEDENDDGDDAPPRPPLEEPRKESQRQKEARKRRFAKRDDESKEEAEAEAQKEEKEEAPPVSSSSSSTPMGDVLPDEKPSEEPKPVIKKSTLSKETLAKLNAIRAKRIAKEEEEKKEKEKEADDKLLSRFRKIMDSQKKVVKAPVPAPSKPVPAPSTRPIFINPSNVSNYIGKPIAYRSKNSLTNYGILEKSLPNNKISIRNQVGDIITESIVPLGDSGVSLAFVKYEPSMEGRLEEQIRKNMELRELRKK